ncbi:MAG: hypothetical protein ABIJ34_06225 [archaeon]
MGFLNFFKQRELTVDLDKLEEWVNSESKSLLSEAMKKIQSIKDYTTNAISDINGQLVDLGKDQLSNSQIPAREKQLMEGNREIYIKKTSFFISQINIPSDYSKLDEYSQELEISTSKYQESTARAYYVLTNFFDDRMKMIAPLLKKIERSGIDAKNLSKDPTVSMHRMIISRIKEIKNAQIEQEHATKELKNLETESDAEKIRKEELKDKLDKLKESKDYHEFHKLEKRKKELEESISQLNTRFLNDLQVYSRAAKKFAQGNNLLSIYLENPLKALANDRSLEIMMIIQKIKMEVSFGHIDIKQREKLLGYELSRKYFEDMKTEYDKMRREKSDIISRQDGMSVMMDYKELIYHMEHNDTKIKRLKENTIERKNHISHLSVNSKKKHLEEILSGFTKKKVTINV